jgi:PPOX class probable F420-dependent enzyme
MRSPYGRSIMPNGIAQFADAKYLNLETFRKTGVGVRTPVWFVRDVLHNAPTITAFYIYSEADAGKVKRIRNNPKVRVAPCTMRGDVRGAWIDGRARICEDDEAAYGQQLLTQKYGLLKILGDFFSRLMRHNQTVIAVEVD